MQSHPKFRINPFRPDDPVEPELFAGRNGEIQQIETALFNLYQKKAQRILVQGERWIGKSSIARYTEAMATGANLLLNVDDANFYATFIRLGSCRNLDEICVALINGFKRCENTAKRKIFSLLSSIKGLQVGPLGVQFDIDTTREILVPTFPSLLESLLDEAKTTYKGFLIILDETEKVSALLGVASFLKTLFEQLDADGYSNVMFLVTATPEGVSKLTFDHPSFPRLFRHVNLRLMEEDESRDLLGKALKKGFPLVKIEESAVEFIHHYSDGLPSLLQELGFVSFEANSDDKIDEDDVIAGIVGLRPLVKGALDTLYDKHFRKILTEDLLSDRYRTILNVFAKSKDEVLSSADIRAVLEPSHDWQIAPYLGNLVKRGILNRLPGELGKYRMASRMLTLWLRLGEVREERTRGQRHRKRS